MVGVEVHFSIDQKFSMFVKIKFLQNSSKNRAALGSQDLNSRILINMRQGSKTHRQRDGWNNPAPSAIDLDLFLNYNGVSKMTYMFL